METAQDQAISGVPALAPLPRLEPTEIPSSDVKNEIDEVWCDQGKPAERWNCNEYGGSERRNSRPLLPPGRSDQDADTVGDA